MKQHILFIDDEPNFLNGITGTLHRQHQKWEVHSAQSVDAALAIGSKAAFDGIVFEQRTLNKFNTVHEQYLDARPRKNGEAITDG